MNIDIINIKGIEIAEITSEEVIIRETQDALDIMANCAYQGAEKIIVHQRCITPDFFELKTGIAGDILQKFSTYGVSLAIVGDYTSYTSKSLRDFIYESNKLGRINFVNSMAEAIEVLTK